MILPFFYMRYILSAIISAILFLSCDVSNIQDDKKDLSEYSMCSVNLSSLTDDYDKLVWKDPNHFILSRTNDDGSSSLDIIKCDQDTVIVCYYEENGLPRVISDGETYVFLGGYQGNKFRAVSINSEEKSDVFEIDADVNFDPYLALFENNTKVATKADELSDKAKHEGYLALKGVLEACWNKFVLNGGFVPGGANTPLFFMEALSYLISSDELWVETVHSTFEWAGYAVIIGETAITGTTGPIGLGFAIYNVYWNKILKPLIDGGYLLPASDPRSAYGEKLDYYYHHISSAVFQTLEHSFSWLGDSYDVELFSNGNFDVTASDWCIVEDYPDWINPSLYDSNGHVFLHVSVDNNAREGSRPRTDVITVRWIDPQQIDTYASFFVNQSSRPYTEPGVVSFSDKTSVRVFVFSEEEWQVYDKPNWCITKKKDHYILDIEKDNSISNPQEGVITLMAKTKRGDFPFHISVYPGDVLSVLGRWKIIYGGNWTGAPVCLQEGGTGYLPGWPQDKQALRWSLSGNSFHLESDFYYVRLSPLADGSVFREEEWSINETVIDGQINPDFTIIEGTMLQYEYIIYHGERGKQLSFSCKLEKDDDKKTLVPTLEAILNSEKEQQPWD